MERLGWNGAEGCAVPYVFVCGGGSLDVATQRNASSGNEVGWEADARLGAVYRKALGWASSALPTTTVCCVRQLSVLLVA